jgi:hypothetical protein
MRDLVVVADLDVVGEFMTTRGTLLASSDQLMQLDTPEMRFTNLLAPVQGIMYLMKGLGVVGAFLDARKEGPTAASASAAASTTRQSPSSRSVPKTGRPCSPGRTT